MLSLGLLKAKGASAWPIVDASAWKLFFLKHLRKKQTHLGLFEASKRYGKIFGFRIGSQLIVVLHGYDAIHQALVKQAHVFSDRPNFLPVFRRVLKMVPKVLYFKDIIINGKCLGDSHYRLCATLGLENHP